MSWDLNSLFKRKEADSLDNEGLDLEGDNTTARNKNIIITGIVLICAGLAYAAFKIVTAPPYIAPAPTPDYEPVITDDFTERDSQSALQAQQQIITQMQKDISQLTRQRNDLAQQVQTGLDKLDERFQKAFEEAERNWNNDMDALQNQMQTPQEALLPSQPPQYDANGALNRDPFGSLGNEPVRPPSYPQYYEQPDLKDDPISKRQGIQTFSYSWPKAGSQTVYRRSSKNYVPTGSFVTAVLIGAADANAGVNAQGDTAPILFRTIHDGILPNGKRSHLKGCFVTASVYGEISSNRGIARLQRMSCIFDKKGNEEIIDIPVRGTAFNFGRNGIRGTPVMRNGKIMQLAGISGIFSGLGDTAKNASSSTITNPSGVISTVDPSQALLNMGGSALESVGSKLSDYYIKLAEQYHPIIELNPGAVVNLVFLEGFPLDPAKIDEYENRLSSENPTTDAATQIMANFMNPLAALPRAQPQQQGQPQNNPLINQLPAQLQPSAERYHQTQQQPTVTPAPFTPY